MKTERTNVGGTCYIWAVPKSDYQLQQEVKDEGDAVKVIPFKYVIRTSSTHWQTDAVLVHEFPVTGTVPEGVDLIKAAVQTMHDEIIRIRKEADKSIAELEERISKLALLEYTPEPS